MLISFDKVYFDVAISKVAVSRHFAHYPTEIVIFSVYACKSRVCVTSIYTKFHRNSISEISLKK